MHAHPHLTFLCISNVTLEIGARQNAGHLQRAKIITQAKWHAVSFQYDERKKKGQHGYQSENKRDGAREVIANGFDIRRTDFLSVLEKRGLCVKIITQQICRKSGAAVPIFCTKAGVRVRQIADRCAKIIARVDAISPLVRWQVLTTPSAVNAKDQVAWKHPNEYSSDRCYHQVGQICNLIIPVLFILDYG